MQNDKYYQAIEKVNIPRLAKAKNEYGKQKIGEWKSHMQQYIPESDSGRHHAVNVTVCFRNLQ